MSGPDVYIAAVVTMMFVAGVALVIREARHQSMVKNNGVFLMTESTDEPANAYAFRIRLMK
jgi:hypothetical protein